MWQLDPRATPGNYVETNCNTANEIPRLEDTGIVPHYLPGQNPEADFMMRTYNLPKEAALGYAESLYPEYRKKIKGIYTPPASCGRYCCGWIERQGLPGAAPGLACNDGGLGDASPGCAQQVRGTAEVKLLPCALICALIGRPSGRAAASGSLGQLDPQRRQNDYSANGI